MSEYAVLPPSTESVIINYKRPLRKVKDGFGYLGVVTYDKGKTHTQCHICGSFYVGLGYHVRKAHNLSVNDYREEYSLRRSVPLIAPITRQKHIDNWRYANKDARAAMLDRMKRGREKIATLNTNGNTNKTLSLEARNLRGTCPDQLLNKITLLGQTLGRAPSQKEFIKHYKLDVRVVYQTFGSWKNAVKNRWLHAKQDRRLYQSGNVHQETGD